MIGDVRVNLVLLDVRFNKDPKAKDILGSLVDIIFVEEIR